MTIKHLGIIAALALSGAFARLCMADDYRLNDYAKGGVQCYGKTCGAYQLCQDNPTVTGQPPSGSCVSLHNDCLLTSTACAAGERCYYHLSAATGFQGKCVPISSPQCMATFGDANENGTCAAFQVCLPFPTYPIMLACRDDNNGHVPPWGN